MAFSTRWTKKSGALLMSATTQRGDCWENREKLDAIVAQLLVHESLDEPEIYAAAGIAHPPDTNPPSGMLAKPLEAGVRG